jgi:uncharacterized protein
MLLENTKVKKILLTTMIFLSLMLVIAVSGFIFQAARAQTQPTSTPTPQVDVYPTDQLRTITVSGSGAVSIVPDRAVFVVGVSTQAPTAGQAMEENNQRMQALMDALLGAGVAQTDIQTQSISLFPQFSSEPQPTDDEREITGYVAINTVRVESGDIDALGTLLDAAVGAGGNTIHSVHFEISNPAQALDEARQMAWDNALHKARQLAGLAGTPLGPVISVTEYSASPRPASPEVGRDQAAMGIPIQPGVQESQVNLEITWMLGVPNGSSGTQNP